MATRTVTGTIYHLDGTAWDGGEVTFVLLAPFLAAGSIQPTEEHSVILDAGGAFSLTLAVPDTGTARYAVKTPDGRAYEFYLDAGAAIDLQTILSILVAPVTPSALQTIIDASMIADVKTKTALYTIAPGDEIIRCYGTFAVILPPAFGSGVAYAVKNIGTGMGAVMADGADLIDGAATYLLYPHDRATYLDAAAGVWDVM